jgi:cytochrome P450
MEMRLILGTLLQRLEPQMEPGYSLATKAELSLHPEGPLPAVVRART